MMKCAVRNTGKRPDLLGSTLAAWGAQDRSALILPDPDACPFVLFLFLLTCQFVWFHRYCYHLAILCARSPGRGWSVAGFRSCFRRFPHCAIHLNGRWCRSGHRVVPARFGDPGPYRVLRYRDRSLLVYYLVVIASFDLDPVRCSDPRYALC